MPLTSPATNLTGEYFSRFLDTVGNGSGTKNAIGNYSAVVTDFLISPDIDTKIRLARLIIQIEDVGGFNAAGYGAMNALTNGITVLHFVAGELFADYTDGIVIKTNGHWGRYCFDLSITDFGGNNENYVDARWSFFKGGMPLILLPADSLTVRLNDNFNALVSHTFIAQGLIV